MTDDGATSMSKLSVAHLNTATGTEANRGNRGREYTVALPNQIKNKERERERRKKNRKRKRNKMKKRRKVNIKTSVCHTTWYVIYVTY